MPGEKVNNNKKSIPRIVLLTFLVDPIGRDLALAYLKAYFLKYSRFSKKIDILILSLSINDKYEDVIERLVNLNPEVVGFSCYVWSIDKALVLSRKLKQVLPKLKIVLGGPEVSPQAESTLKQEASIDAVVINEGEETFKELIEHWLRPDGDLRGVRGISFKQNKEIINNPARDLISPLGRIPSPYLEKIINPDKKAAVLETMRGCMFGCRYCYYNKQFNKLRYFPLERIKKELRLLLKKNVSTIYLMDPTFNLKKGRALAILNYFIKYRKGSKLHLEVKAELLDEGFIRILSLAGVEFLEIGLQTTNRNALKNINRDFDERLFKNNIKLLNEKNINYSIHLIVGLPGDDYEGFKASLDSILELEPPNIDIFKLMVLPGTKLWQDCRDFKLKFEPKTPYYVLESFSYDNKELLEMERLGHTALFLYKNLFSAKNLSLICRLLSLNLSDVCEEWQEWMASEHRDLYKSHNLKLPAELRVKAAMFNIKLTELAKEFTALIFKKYSGMLMPYFVSDSIARDSREFLEKRGIFKEKLANCLN